MPSIVALDIETTGLDNVRDAIIEIGAVRFNDRRVEGEWSTLINPRRAVPPEITKLTGITSDMVRHAPILEEVRDDLEAFVGEAPVLGHNVGFDMGFLQQRGLLGLNEMIDTYALSTVLLPTASRYNLGALGQLLGIPFPATHRALDDARVSHQIFIQFLEKVRALPLDLLAEITRLGDPFEWGGDVIFRQVMRERARETVESQGDSIQARRVAPPGDGYGPLFGGLNRAGGRAPRMDQRPAPLIPDPDPFTPLDPDAVAAILEYGGEFSRHFPQFEHRAEQVEMLRTVVWALSEGRHLMVEAGTGTGKSVAYLVPASLWALQNNTRVVVSTNTINLQDQLVSKDIPDIIEAMDVPLRAAVLKGRSNYLCPRRFETMRRQGPESADEVRLLAKTLVWLMEGGSGDRQEINLHAGERFAWERISAADDACTNDTCMRRAGGTCPFYRARQAAQNAHIIIVNHALLLADVATGNRVLPEYQYLIVDEAHHMEAAVTNALSFRISQFEVERTMRELGSTNGGVLGRLLTTLHDVIQPSHYAAMYALAEQATTSAIYFQNASRNFFVEIDNFLAAMREGRDIGPYSQQVRILPATRTQPAWMDVETIWDEAGASLRSLRTQLEQIAKGMVELMEGGFEGAEDAYGDLSNLFRRLSEIDNQMEGLVFKPDPNQVYWAEVQSDGRRLSLNAAPLHIGPLMQEHLWHQKTSVILTSATLTTHGEFEYLRGRLFGEDADTVALGSPFDYESSTLLYIPNNIPEPSDRWGHQRAVEQGLIHLCKMTGGRALALFTSYDQLKRTSNAISGPLAEHGIIVYEQGTGASATALLENFKTSEQAVLLGTRSFWEGVDVPGEALSVLAIIKLPFDVPSDPIIAARSETFENAFQEYTLPEAILRFRQGFGRLIRTKFDRGVVAIFDRRVLTKMYGKLFVESLPQCTVQVGPLQNLPAMAGQWLNL
ncbi:MAG TPA: helicase C-terminal domain-containing protein [Anaerolineales bacterium]|nr:helicase C-terminal domain-containing protein [Anaerolineales bacterium]